MRRNEKKSEKRLAWKKDRKRGRCCRQLIGNKEEYKKYSDYRQTNKQIDRHIDRQTYRTHRQTDTQPDRQTGTQPDRHTYRQTDI